MLEVKVEKRLKSFKIEANFRVKEKEYVVVLGRSGAGKSMIAKVISGIERADRCKVILKGKDISNLPPEKRRISYLPQSNTLFPHMSILENLEFPLRIRKEKFDKRKVEEIASQFNIKEILFKRPSEVSGGEVQRVALARAILSDPEVIILDEPLSSLDFLTKIKLIDFLKELKGRRTILHITHDPLEAEKLADRVLYVERGKTFYFESWKDFVERARGELPQKIREFFPYRQQS